MKKINRFKVLFIATAIIFGWLAIGNYNPYFNAFVIGVAFVAYLLSVAFITDNMTEKEESFRDRFLEKIFGYNADNEEDMEE